MTCTAFGFPRGKMLVRVDPEDPAGPATLDRCATASSSLPAPHLVALVELLMSGRADSRLHNDLSPDAVLRWIAVASGLGNVGSPIQCR